MTKLKRRKVWRPGAGKRAAPADAFAKAGGPLVSKPTRKEVRKILLKKEPTTAIGILAQMARESKETIRILGDLAAERDAHVKMRALTAILGLADACGDVPGLLPNLVMAALDRETEPGHGAGTASSLGPILLLGLPILGIELMRGETEARIAAARAIGAVASHGYNVASLTQALAKGLMDRDGRVQKAALAAIGETEAAGQDIKFLVPSLLAVSTNEEDPIQAEVLKLVRKPSLSAKLPGMLGVFASQIMGDLEDHLSRVQTATVIDAVMRSEPFLEGLGRQDAGYLQARSALDGVLAEIARLEQADATPKS